MLILTSAQVALANDTLHSYETKNSTSAL